MEHGQAMVEYALILSLVVAGLIVAFTSLGTTTVHLVNQVVSQLGP